MIENGVILEVKSTITKLYDYSLCALPDECRLWRISDEELQAHLEMLSRNHAFEAEVDTVRMGDSVACRSESSESYWSRPVLLFYPGREICDAEAENACVGAKLGEKRTVTMEGAEVTLTVERILRRSNMPIGDALAKAEGIEGVETLDAYRKWYRQTNEPTRALHASYRGAMFLLHRIAEKSEFLLDEEEKRTWLTNRVNRLYDALVDAGFDPKIPKEGFDFLTEEQAKAKMYAEQEHFFTEYVADCYMLEKLTGCTVQDVVNERLPALAAGVGMSVEEIIRQSGEAMVYGKFASEGAMEALSDYTKRFLEE